MCGSSATALTVRCPFALIVRPPPQALTGYVQPYCKSAVGASFLLLQGGGHPQIDSAAGRRICPRWLSTCTGTGRLSCRGPNLQALPRNAEKAGITLVAEGKP